jgi:hypothetical protein
MIYVQGAHRPQTALFCLEDFNASDAPVRVVDAFCNDIDYKVSRKLFFTATDNLQHYTPTSIKNIHLLKRKTNL